MANNCLACERLKEYAYNFVVNGITDAECDSLRVNQGLNPNLADHDNCEALNDMLDCLIGNLHDRLPSFSICDWREYVDELMTNMYNFKKALTCSICGQWDALNEIDNRISNIERILSAILHQMRQVNAWSAEGAISENVQPNLRGIPSTNINLAAGNINLFGNASGNRFIRTNSSNNNPQDIRGGLE